MDRTFDLPKSYHPRPGYRDANLDWHEGEFNLYEWMVEGVLTNADRKK